MPRSKQQDRSFGPRLAALRKARGLTQVRLAQAARTIQRAASYYENYDGLPPAAALIDLARVLKVTADELLGLKAPKVERIDDDPRVGGFGRDFRWCRRYLRRTGAPSSGWLIRLCRSALNTAASGLRADSYASCFSGAGSAVGATRRNINKNRFGGKKRIAGGTMFSVGGSCS
jgi:transcriptional regulator with XRE-family HTH domain